MAALCLDCGIDTAPCTGRRGCRHAGRWDYYMVDNALWEQVADRGFLCIPCLEARIGRTLTPADFPDLPINEPDPWDTPLLAARKTSVSHR